MLLTNFNAAATNSIASESVRFLWYWLIRNLDNSNPVNRESIYLNNFYTFLFYVNVKKSFFFFVKMQFYIDFFPDFMIS